MMDAEYSYLTHDESTDLQEAYVKKLFFKVFFDRAPQPWKLLERDTELLKRYIAEPFKRITYDQAIDLLQEHEMMKDADYEHLEHGDDFGSPHETWISNHFGVPTFVMNYPAAIKAFYMKPVPGNPERVLCADLPHQKAMEKSSVDLCVRKTTMPFVVRWMNLVWIVLSMNSTLTFVNTVQYHTEDLVSVSSVW